MITQISCERIHFSLVKQIGEENAAHSVDIMSEWSFSVNVVILLQLSGILLMKILQQHRHLQQMYIEAVI